MTNDERVPPTGQSLFDRTARRAWQLTVMMVCLYLLAMAARELRSVVLPLVIGLLIAAGAHPMVRWLHQRSVPMVLAALIPLLGLVLLLLGASLLVAASIQGEQDVLIASLQNASESSAEALKWVEGRVGSDLFDSATKAIAGYQDRVPRLATELVAGIVSGVSMVLLAVVFCFFFLIDLDVMSRAVEKRMSPSSYQRLARVTSASWTRLESYVRGLSLTALCNALLFGLALLVIGVPLIPASMLVLFVGSFIPYAGPILATAFAAAVALGAGDLTDALFVVGAGVAVQVIEGNVLQPWIVGKAVSMSPFITVLSVVGGAAAAGLIGAMIAVPVAGAAIIVIDALRVHRDEVSALVV